MKFLKVILSLLFLLPLIFSSYAAPTGQDLGAKWCSDVKMHFYAGGPEAGGFAGIVARCYECYQRYRSRCRNIIL